MPKKKKKRNKKMCVVIMAKISTSSLHRKVSKQTQRRKQKGKINKLTYNNNAIRKRKGRGVIFYESEMW